VGGGHIDEVKGPMIGIERAPDLVYHLITPLYHSQTPWFPRTRGIRRGDSFFKP
jgi:hypothetical protein